MDYLYNNKKQFLVAFNNLGGQPLSVLLFQDELEHTFTFPNDTALILLGRSQEASIVKQLSNSVPKYTATYENLVEVMRTVPQKYSIILLGADAVLVDNFPEDYISKFIALNTDYVVSASSVIDPMDNITNGRNLFIPNVSKNISCTTLVGYTDKLIELCDRLLATAAENVYFLEAVGENKLNIGLSFILTNLENNNSLKDYLAHVDYNNNFSFTFDISELYIEEHDDKRYFKTYARSLYEEALI